MFFFFASFFSCGKVLRKYILCDVVAVSCFGTNKINWKIGGRTSGKIAYLPEGDMYEMAYDGTNVGYFWPSSYDIPSGCGNLLYRIFDSWDSNMLYLSGHSNCSAAVGYFYDPTISCAPESGSIYCTDMMSLCNDSSYSYECDYSQAETRFLCAPGDLSGKFGSLNSSASYVEFTENDDFMIDLNLLDGNKSLVLQCENTYEIIACGQFMNYSYTTLMPTRTPTMPTGIPSMMPSRMPSMMPIDDDETSTTTSMDDETSTTDDNMNESDNGFATFVQFGTSILVTITMIKLIV